MSDVVSSPQDLVGRACADAGDDIGLQDALRQLVVYVGLAGQEWNELVGTAPT
jgi:hypothetical protein